MLLDRSLEQFYVIDYLFVLDQAPGTNWASPDLQGEGKLLGIVSLRDLLLSPDGRTLDEIMSTDFLWAEADEPCEKAARRMADYNLIAMPVLDGAERLKIPQVGNVIIEAQASGVPVIVSDSGGPKELVENDRNGLITKSHDVEDLTRAIRELVADPERRKRMGNFGRESVIGRTWPNAFRKFWAATEV